MTPYRAPLDDILFALDTAGLDDVLALPGVEVTRETVVAILEEAGRFGEGVIAPTNRIGDLEGCTLENGAVRTPAPFADAYRQFCAAGWNSAAHDAADGGQGLPRLVATAVSEIWHGANLALGLCPTLTDGAATLLAAHGDAALKRLYLEKLVSGDWTGAMVMTEPQAGSDIGALTCRAEPDGNAYRLSGQKIFISWGDHDLTDNIVHMVLARLPDAPAGSRGVSLFLVPKFIPGVDGAPGPRNAMRPVGLERKLGLHGSPTCVMQYDGAQGWMIGEPNRGLAAMFVMMNTARLAIGHEGIGVAERAYQQALSYAGERLQGRAPDGTGPAPIIAHGDVQRMLLAMKARIAAMRSLALYAAASVDMAAHHPDPDQRALHAARVGLLTPVVKAWCTDGAVEIASLGIQVHGGAGYIEETGAAQHLRDARILPIYEGTNGIQAMDLVGRKVAGDGGAAAQALISDLHTAAPDCREVHDALALLSETTEAMIAAWRDRPQAAGAGAAPYLALFAAAAGGALLASGAARHADPAQSAVAGYYLAAVLPAAAGLAAQAIAGAKTVDEAAERALEAGGGR